MRLTDSPRRDVPVAIGVVLIFTLLAWPVTGCGCSKMAAKATVCLSNLKQQGLGMIMYAEDVDRHPLRDSWMDGIAPYVKDKNAFHDPEGSKGGYGYAFNGALSRAQTPPHPESVPMAYDSLNPIRNASDLVTSLPSPGRHHGKDEIAYADGHARSRRVP